jgi:hypothetical protein
MPYELTEHARIAITERRIRMDWIQRVVENPELLEPDEDDAQLEHRLGKIFENDNRVLRVIIDPDARPIRIITAYFDRAMRKKL